MTSFPVAFIAVPHSHAEEKEHIRLAIAASLGGEESVVLPLNHQSQHRNGGGDNHQPVHPPSSSTLLLSSSSSSLSTTMTTTKHQPPLSSHQKRTSTKPRMIKPRGVFC